MLANYREVNCQDDERDEEEIQKTLKFFKRRSEPHRRQRLQQADPDGSGGGGSSDDDGDDDDGDDDDGRAGSSDGEESSKSSSSVGSGSQGGGAAADDRADADRDGFMQKAQEGYNSTESFNDGGEDVMQQAQVGDNGTESFNDGGEDVMQQAWKGHNGVGTGFNGDDEYDQDEEEDGDSEARAAHAQQKAKLERQKLQALLADPNCCHNVSRSLVVLTMREAQIMKFRDGYPLCFTSKVSSVSSRRCLELKSFCFLFLQACCQHMCMGVCFACSFLLKGGKGRERACATMTLHGAAFLCCVCHACACLASMHTLLFLL
jgi:hypothetical protein